MLLAFWATYLAMVAGTATVLAAYLAGQWILRRHRRRSSEQA